MGGEIGGICGLGVFADLWPVGGFGIGRCGTDGWKAESAKLSGMGHVGYGRVEEGLVEGVFFSESFLSCFKRRGGYTLMSMTW